jgi:hypothetical protein
LRARDPGQPADALCGHPFDRVAQGAIFERHDGGAPHELGQRAGVVALGEIHVAPGHHADQLAGGVHDGEALVLRARRTRGEPGPHLAECVAAQECYHVGRRALAYRHLVQRVGGVL